MKVCRVLALALVPSILLLGGNQPTLAAPKNVATAPAKPQTPTSRFLAVVDKFKKFFATSPVAYSKQKFSSSPTGLVFSSYKYSIASLEYDIRKTDSIVSPYIGYIDAVIVSRENKKGNVFSQYSEISYYGWDNFEDAVKASRDDSLFVDDNDPESIRFTFAYQDEKWVYKGAIRTKYNNPPIVIDGAMGNSNGVALPVDENKPWRDLVK